VMRKHVLDPAPLPSDAPVSSEWLKLQEIADVEVTSEANGYPIESAFTFGAGPGWRAASSGKQRVRLVFDQPPSIKRILLQFKEPTVARTQEFSIQWSGGAKQSSIVSPLKTVVVYTARAAATTRVNRRVTIIETRRCVRGNIFPAAGTRTVRAKRDPEEQSA
jgi:hypothetical protein